MVKIDSDGDVAVAFGNQAWVFNPGLLTPVTGGKVDVLDDEADSDSAQEEEDDANSNIFIILELQYRQYMNYWYIIMQRFCTLYFEFV